MILNSPTISGSLTVTGNIIASGSITLSGSVASASYAATASFVALAQSASYVLTAQTASFVANAQTASFVALAQSASNAVSAQTASFANAFTVASTLTAQTLVVQTITSSVDFVTGSTRFGSILGNTHVFSGSVTMNPGGLFVSSSGLVGIGNIVPAYTLDVTGTGRFSLNVGIGTTLSSWGSNVTSLELPYGVSFYAWNASAVPQLYLNANAYFDGSNFKYKVSGQLASQYYQYGGQHIFYTAPSGTAGNNITFTPALTIASTGAATFSSTVDATQGNFTSAPSIGGYQVKSVSNSSGNTSYGGVLVINSTGKGGYLTCGDNSSTTWYGAQAGYVTLAGTAGAGMKFRVDADDDKGMMIFPTTGNITMGTIYDLGYELNLYSSDLANTKGTLSMRNGANNAGGYFVLFQNNSGGTAGVISQTGSTTINYGASSDYRLKEDLKDFTGLDKVSAIKVYDFKWKDEDLRAYGTMAHELQEIIPTAVNGNKDEINKDGSIKTQQVDYSKLVPILVKAIQELKAQNDALQSRIETLESK
jgi:hypothetical protein